MAKLVLIIAQSGTGKSSSMRNLKKGEAAVILCSGKELPFRTELPTLVPKNYQEVFDAINTAKTPIVVIDDTNYLMSFEEMARVNESGYGKFTQMASNMFKVFKTIIDKPGDQIFYVMAHAETRDDALIRFKTSGKMLSDKVVLEGLTNIVLTTEIIDGEFVFRTQTDGNGVKSPIGMFKQSILPNDLKVIDAEIRGFYKPESTTTTTTKGKEGEKK